MPSWLRKTAATTTETTTTKMTTTTTTTTTKLILRRVPPPPLQFSLLTPSSTTRSRIGFSFLQLRCWAALSLCFCRQCSLLLAVGDPSPLLSGSAGGVANDASTLP
ncbi:unnamed protein product [Polarella glacialis]|uniref:Uncharacterized protein n=1 Tax=Polarella glacialis TaxID=89957 RepID=A0A813HRF9_POLGL|nr:unnamed protein product [Polarella glacialis]